MTNEVLQKTASDEQNVSSSNGLEARLRFPEFEGKTYNKIKLKELSGNISSGKSKKNKGCVPLYGSTGIIGLCAVPEYTGKKILVARVGANAGFVNLVEEDCGVSDNTLVILDTHKYVIKWLYYHLNFYDLKKLIFGSGQPLITGGELQNIDCTFPSLSEQQKIADFLSLVDQRIEKQRLLVESLKKYKRGLFLKLYGNFEKKSYKISDLGKYCATGTLSKDDIDVSGEYQCILYGELFTKYGETISQVISRTNVTPTYLSGSNEILFPSSTTADALSLIFPSSLKIENIFLGGDLFTIKLKNEFDSDFISYLINFVYKNTLARYSQGITIIHLHYTDIKEQIINIPDIVIQLKISDIMKKIEAIIENNDNKLKSLLLMKKSFLQQMFI